MSAPLAETSAIHRKEWTLLFANFGLNLIVGLLTGLVVGIVVWHYQVQSTQPLLSVTVVRLDQNRVQMQLKNAGNGPAFGVSGAMSFSNAISAHHQSPNVFSSNGAALAHGTYFSGQSTADFFAQIVPPNTTYFIEFSFSSLTKVDSASFYSAEGPLHVTY